MKKLHWLRALLIAGTILPAAAVAMLVCTGEAQAQTDNVTFTVVTSVYDPAHSFELASKWVKGLGVAPELMNSMSTDTNDPRNEGLILSADGLNSAGKDGSALAQLIGVKGIKQLTEVGFDLRTGSNCSAGNPRFYITTASGCSYFTGCGYTLNEIGPTTLYGSWNRYRWNPTSAPPLAPSSSCGAFAPTDQVESIYIIFDAGNDGFAILDNIDVNTALVGHGS